MQLISFGYQQVVALRNELFNHGFFPIYHSEKPVISIGNLAFGGTGKTSLTELLARTVGRPVAILERGYKARIQRDEPFLVTSPDEGDEAYLLQQKLPFAQVIVGKRRVESAKLAETLPVDYILLDDGMQHRYLHRDIEIVVLHKQGGALRERFSSLKRADYVVVNGVTHEEECSWIKQYTDAPIIGVSYEVLNREEIAHRRVAAFCGIGKPLEFYRLLEELGCTIVHRKTLPDHGYMENLEGFIHDAELIVCTEKDAVKVHGPVTPLRVELRVRFGHAHWNNLCHRI